MKKSTLISLIKETLKEGSKKKQKFIVELTSDLNIKPADIESALIDKFSPDAVKIDIVTKQP